jgi:hypothetical protein
MQLDSDLDLRIGAVRQYETDCGRIGKIISGTGALTLTLGNHDISATTLFKLGVAGANTYQGGTTVRHISRISYGAGHGIVTAVQLNAVSTGAFGTGDVTLDGTGCTTTSKLTGVETGRGMWVRLSANNAVASHATLTLVSQANIALELAMGTAQTLAAVICDGTPVAAGTYTGGSFPWLYGTGTLIIGDGSQPPVLVPEIGLLGSNGNTITNGSSIVSQPLGTDFGQILWEGTLSVTNTFAITNSGTGTLTLSGAPVTVLGAHSADFTVTQPVSSSITAGQSVTFKIASDPSALGVRTGLVSIASNDTDENPYTFSIRAEGTAAPKPPPNRTLNLSFQQGDGGAYSETAFTYIEERNGADDNYGTSAIINLNETYRNTTHMIFQGLIGYFNIIGTANGQIPAKAVITSATLTLTVSDAGASGTPITLHTMLKPWVENQATWTLLQTASPFGNSATNPLDNAAALLAHSTDPIDNGGGMPGVDYVEASVASIVAYPVGKISFDVTAVVQAWANGTPNYGLYLQYLAANNIVIASDDAAALSDRPLLTVSGTVPSTQMGTVLLFYLGQ